MLQWIEGGSGSGKSYWIREKIASLASRGEKVLLIVPEQYSFETEREYYGLLGCRQMETVTVASFLKLSELIFREYGGLAGEYASDTAKRAIMRLAMKACRDDLRLYRKNISHPDFVDQMVRLQEELANSGVLPGQLEEAALKTEKSSLKDKLFDLELLFESYRSLLNRRYLDPSDRLGRALELARGKGFFQETYIFLDEFKSFTALQQSFLRLMLREGSGVVLYRFLEREGEGRQRVFGVLDNPRPLL
ncbi:MAG: hypothetical protein PUC57_09045 [Oscillospiraceae bacterium]|nr:hypothetical protein [Oscillospiraceae bacterium]